MISLISHILIEIFSGLGFLRSKDGKVICFTLVVMVVGRLVPWKKALTAQRILRIPSTPVTSLVAFMSCYEVQ